MKYLIFFLALSSMTLTAFGSDGDVQPTEFFYLPTKSWDVGVFGSYHNQKVRQRVRSVFQGVLQPDGHADVEFREILWGLNSHYKVCPHLTFKGEITFEDFRATNDVTDIITSTGANFPIASPIPESHRVGFRSISLTPMTGFKKEYMDIYAGLKFEYFHQSDFDSLSNVNPYYWDSFTFTPHVGFAVTPGPITWGLKLSYLLRTTREGTAKNDLTGQLDKVKALGGHVFEGDLVMEVSSVKAHPGFVLSYIQSKQARLTVATNANNLFGAEEGFGMYRRLGGTLYTRIPFSDNVELVPSAKYFFAMSEDFGTGTIEKARTFEYEAAALVRMRM